MDVASIVAKDSSAALGLVARQMGGDAVLIGTRSHARGVELMAASARVAPAVTRFTAQARTLGFAEDSYAPLLRAIADPVSAADLWVRFVAGIERRLGIGAPPGGGVALFLAGPAEGTTAVAAQIAAARKVKPVAVEAGQAPPKTIPRDAVFYIATDDLIAARAAMRRFPDLGTLVLLPPDSSADDWAVTFATCDGAVIAENLERPGAMLSVLLGTGLALAAIAGPEGIAAARLSTVCRSVVVALGRIGSGSGMASAPDLAPTYQPPGAPPNPRHLIASHGNLVRKIAWHVHGRARGSVEIEDLVQIGMLALVESAGTFVQRGEAVFSTYATLRVKGAMIDHLRRAATIPRGAMQSARRLRETAAELAKELGRDPSNDEMAAKLGLSAGAYRATVDAAAGSRTDSLDEVYSDHSLWFAADLPDAFDDAAREELRQALADHIGKLPEREALVLQLYFVEELNLDEIGAVLDVGAARVCQIKKAALDKLRAALRDWEE